MLHCRTCGILVPWPETDLSRSSENTESHLLDRQRASAVILAMQPHGPQPARLLCPQGSPARTLGWVAMPSSRGSSWPRDRTHFKWVLSIKQAPALQVDSLPPGTTREVTVTGINTSWESAEWMMKTWRGEQGWTSRCPPYNCRAVTNLSEPWFPLGYCYLFGSHVVSTLSGFWSRGSLVAALPNFSAKLSLHPTSELVSHFLFLNWNLSYLGCE